MLKKKLEYVLFIAWAVALVSTLGSLYFSEIMGFVPCNLCWYQRIFMYPLVILFGVAILRKEATVTHYAFPFAFLGGLIALYQVVMTKFPALGQGKFTCGKVPCNEEYINWFGFISIPLLSLFAFIIIGISCIYIFFLERKMW